MTSGRVCPACGGGAVTVFFEMPPVPVYCNVLWGSPEEARDAPRGEIALGLCSDCGFIHNSRFDPSLVSYSTEYENSLHFSPRFEAFADALVERLIEAYGIRNSTVVDVGCGKGEFLSMICRRGENRGIGYDSSFDPADGTIPGDVDVTIIREMFTARTAPEEADLVVCRHVLEHIVEPRPFVELLHRLAARRTGTVVYLEVPNVLFTLHDLGIWDVIYEHVGYFSAGSLVRLCRDVGLQPVQVETAYGDQFLCLDARTGASGAPVDMADLDAEREPEVERLIELSQVFAQKFESKRAYWRQWLADGARQDRRVVVWGAGSKGVTFLNLVAAAGPIAAAIDLNPRKHGRFVPGTGHEVLPPEELLALRPDEILVMNPVYRGEIAAYLRELGLSPRMIAV
jgi:SAM-dependent methyltransferase